MLLDLSNLRFPLLFSGLLLLFNQNVKFLPRPKGEEFNKVFLQLLLQLNKTHETYYPFCILIALKLNIFPIISCTRVIDFRDGNDHIDHLM